MTPNRTWKMRMPPEKVATAETMTSKSREISGRRRLSWYSARPPAMSIVPRSSAGLKSTFTMALVSRARARVGRPLAFLLARHGLCNHLLPGAAVTRLQEVTHRFDPNHMLKLTGCVFAAREACLRCAVPFISLLPGLLSAVHRP